MTNAVTLSCKSSARGIRTAERAPEQLCICNRKDGDSRLLSHNSPRSSQLAPWVSLPPGSLVDPWYVGGSLQSRHTKCSPPSPRRSVRTVSYVFQRWPIQGVHLTSVLKTANDQSSNPPDRTTRSWLSVINVRTRFFQML
jgi:hypothetical protein